MTPDATRRRAIGQILLLTAGLFVLTFISAGSVYLVNQAREDAAGWSTPLKSKTRYCSPNCWKCVTPKAPQRGYIPTLLPDFLTDFDTAAAGFRR